MNYKNILSLGVLTIFAAGGLYKLYQHRNRKIEYNQAVADVAKDGIESINCLTKIYSNNKKEVDLCEDISNMGKDAIDFVTAIDRKNGGRYHA